MSDISVYTIPEARPFKPLEVFDDYSKRRELQKTATKLLESDSFETAVKLPAGVSLNDWLALHCFEFYNQVSILWGTFAPCTHEDCPKMRAGSAFEYTWEGSSQQSTSAPDYVDRMMTWIKDQLEDTSTFPRTIGKSDFVVFLRQHAFFNNLSWFFGEQQTESEYPEQFQKIVKIIFLRLFRAYAHLYLEHVSIVIEEDGFPYLIYSLKHFFNFVIEFKLIQKADMKPLGSVFNSF
ncbi:13203_t:CDS:2 [Ambispora gerdemannii]|uniref:13203_t:CDS:1 n=1 Tax=Ambispora gerdemannii TaxID=144530 RepID=A0A9N9CJM7_9GLOM|nr:13203_t:CDS:2 [Ambispora gerdemannii]